MLSRIRLQIARTHRVLVVGSDYDSANELRICVLDDLDLHSSLLSKLLLLVRSKTLIGIAYGTDCLTAVYDLGTIYTDPPASRINGEVPTSDENTIVQVVKSLPISGSTQRSDNSSIDWRTMKLQSYIPIEKVPAVLSPRFVEIYRMREHIAVLILREQFFFKTIE